jgi:ADP-ribosylglycohydrolase
MKRVDEMVRVTNNNDLAVAAAKCSAAVLFEILNGRSMESALIGSLQFAGDKLRPLLEQVLAIQTLDNIKVAERFGFACHVPEGLPVVFHIAKCAPDYQAAIESNIRTGGDNCGRAIMLGAFTAAYMVKQGEAMFPIPLEWLARYRKIIAAADACKRF